MSWLIFILIASVIIYFILKSNKNKNGDCPTKSDDFYLPADMKDTSFKEFPIKGISYKNLTSKDVGVFQGYAVTEKNNLYDEYAVAIYRNDGKQLGYIPGSYMTLFEYITSKGGKVPAFGEVFYADDGYYYGKVNVEFNQNYRHDITPPSERKYASPNLKRYSMEIITPEADIQKGRFEGYAVLNNNEPNDFVIDIFNNDSLLIGVVKNQEYLFNTIKEYDNEKVDVWGYFVTYVDKSNNSQTFEAFVYIPARCTANKIAKEKDKFKNQKIQFTIQR